MSFLVVIIIVGLIALAISLFIYPLEPDDQSLTDQERNAW